MSSRARTALFMVSALSFGFLMLMAMAELPSFGNYQGPYGDLINDSVVWQRHTPQSVAAVTFDYRGFDTLGEEFIFFAAVAGVLLLLRTQHALRIPPRINPLSSMAYR